MISKQELKKLIKEELAPLLKEENMLQTAIAHWMRKADLDPNNPEHYDLIKTGIARSVDQGADLIDIAQGAIDPLQQLTSASPRRWANPGHGAPWRNPAGEIGHGGRGRTRVNPALVAGTRPGEIASARQFVDEKPLERASRIIKDKFKGKLHTAGGGNVGRLGGRVNQPTAKGPRRGVVNAPASRWMRNLGTAGAAADLGINVLGLDPEASGTQRLARGGADVAELGLIGAERAGLQVAKRNPAIFAGSAAYEAGKQLSPYAVKKDGAFEFVPGASEQAGKGVTDIDYAHAAEQAGLSGPKGVDWSPGTMADTAKYAATTPARLGSAALDKLKGYIKEELYIILDNPAEKTK